MCGIWAVFGVSADFSVCVSYAMKICHRGPDAFRMETIPHFQNCCLAFHRLAILDDLHGMQPMRVKALPHLYLIYNGEIYNYKKLGKQFGFEYVTNCDAEVILHLYNKVGIERMAQMLDGVFAFCVVDTKNKQVHIGRDTFGVRPLFVLKKAGKKNAGILAVSSEAKALIPLMIQFKKQGCKMKISPCPPGQCASYCLSRNGKTTFIEQKAFTGVGTLPLFETNVKPVWNDVMENIRNLFTEAVRKRLIGDRKIGCLLSGGLDSSLVASYLTKLAKENGIEYPVQTFSVGMEGSTDIVAARKVAQHIGSEHHEVIFTADEGIQALRDIIYSLETWEVGGIRCSVGMYLLCKYIREQTDTVVIFSGEGSDELCQGYINFKLAPSPEEADAESQRLLKDLQFFDVLRCDRCTAAHGLELRVPFLDVQFTSYFLSLPPELRQPKDGIEKFLLRASFEGTGALPDDILWRAKEGFLDGVSSTEPGQTWCEMLKNHFENLIPDEAMATADELYPNNTPNTKEALYYRQVFEEFFPGQSHLIPHYWTAKWINSFDPSARTWRNYKCGIHK